MFEVLVGEVWKAFSGVMVLWRGCDCTSSEHLGQKAAFSKRYFAPDRALLHAGGWASLSSVHASGA